MRFRLRTLLILLAVLPPLLAGIVLFPDIAIVLAVVVIAIFSPFMVPFLLPLIGGPVLYARRESADERDDTQDGPRDRST